MFVMFKSELAYERAQREQERELFRSAMTEEHRLRSEMHEELRTLKEKIGVA